MNDSTPRALYEPKLTRCDKELIIQRLAEFTPLKQIQSELLQVTSKSVTLQAIDYYAKSDRWQAELMVRRRDWLRAVETDIPLSNRKLRLMSLQAIHDGTDDLNIKLKALKQIREEQDSAEKVRLAEELRSAQAAQSQHSQTQGGEQLSSERLYALSKEELEARRKEMEEQLIRRGCMLIPLDKQAPLWRMNDKALMAARMEFADHVRRVVAPEFMARLKSRQN